MGASGRESLAGESEHRGSAKGGRIMIRLLISWAVGLEDGDRM